MRSNCQPQVSSPLVVSGYVGDEILPSYKGIMINNYKDPCERTSISGNRMKVSVIKNFWFRKSNQDKLFSSNVARHCLMSWKGVVWNWYALDTTTNNSSSNRSTTTTSSSTNKKKNNKNQQPHQQQEEHQEQREQQEQETTSKPTSRANLVSSRTTFWQASAEDKRKKILDKVIKELRKVGIPNTRSKCISLHYDRFDSSCGSSFGDFFKLPSVPIQQESLVYMADSYHKWHEFLSERCCSEAVGNNHGRSM